MRLIKIGYWKSQEEPHLPDPTTLGQIDPTVKKRVLQYLSQGKTKIAWKGYSNCRFNCGIPHHKMGSTCLTDGTYQWPEGLYHYVDEHNVTLPQDFITHIMTH